MRVTATGQRFISDRNFHKGFGSGYPLTQYQTGAFKSKTIADARELEALIK